MRSFAWRGVISSRRVAPFLSAFAASFIPRDDKSRCDTLRPQEQKGRTPLASDSHAKPVPGPEGFQADATGEYYGHFPTRQLWKPALPYPLWNKNWDGLHPASTGDPEEDHKLMRHIREKGTTRHIILIRHGQYDEAHKVGGD